jgi:hypothetical protein
LPIPCSRFKVAKLYEAGQGVSQDYLLASQWYERAAEQGDVKAKVHLVRLYHKGAGVPQNEAEAVKLLQRAAGQKNAEAQYLLGRIYWEGRGVPRGFGYTVNEAMVDLTKQMDSTTGIGKNSPSRLKTHVPFSASLASTQAFARSNATAFAAASVSCSSPVAIGCPTLMSFDHTMAKGSHLVRTGWSEDLSLIV